MTRAARRVGTATVFLTAAAAAANTETSFVGPGNGDWNTAGNWSAGVPNSPTDDAYISGPDGNFPAGGSVIYNAGDAYTVGSIQIDNAALQVSAGSTLTTSTLNVAANASYNQSGGTLVTGTLNSLGNFNWTGGVVQITAGSLTIKQSTLVQSWGANESGQLGNGTTTGSSSPVILTGIPNAPTTVSAGGDFAFATQNGVVYAWGTNNLGQLGNGTGVGVYFPTEVASLAGGVTAIAAGYDHSVAIQNGGALTWGNNTAGDLGSAASFSLSPVAVTGLSGGVSFVAAGAAQSFAEQGGALLGWGFNLYGQTDTPVIPMSSTPLPANGLGTGVSAISTGGAHSLVIQNGGAFAFGQNLEGQLGDGSTATSGSVPVPVTGLSSGVTSVAAGSYHSLAVQNGAVYAWGYNQFGQLGIGTTTNSDIPVAVTGITGTIESVAAGENSSYALSSDGSIWDWGSNANGQLGLGSSISMALTPQHLLPPAGYAYSAVSTNAVGNFVVATLTSTGAYSDSSINVGPTMSLQVTGAGQTINVAGSLSLNGGTVTATALTIVAGGTFSWSSGTLLGVATPFCPLNVSAGGVTNLLNPGSAGITVRALSPVGIGGELNVSASANRSSLQLIELSGLPTGTSFLGRIDLSNNDLDIASGGSTLAAVTNEVGEGFNLAGGGNWQGSAGITSTTAAADTSHLAALGVVLNNQSGSPLFTAANPFDGITPGAGDILVRYTIFGDANLDGKVDGSDYSLIDAGYASNGTLTGWFNGDFNYDGVVDGSDYALIDNAFNNQSAPIGPAALSATATVQVAAVPEPALVTTGVFLFGLGHRRQRRTKGNVSLTKQLGPL